MIAFYYSIRNRVGSALAPCAAPWGPGWLQVADRTAANPPNGSGALQGSHYCTFAPDYGCYATGWPSCCSYGSAACPLTRPVCERAENRSGPAAATNRSESPAAEQNATTAQHTLRVVAASQPPGSVNVPRGSFLAARRIRFFPRRRADLAELCTMWYFSDSHFPSPLAGTSGDK